MPMNPTPTPPRRISRLRQRPLTQRDLAECFELLPPWLGLDADLARALPELWLRLKDEPSMVTGVIEDTALPPGARIQGWGVTMILPPALVRALALDTGPDPHVVRRVYAALRDGSFTPMTDREIGVANARGELTMLILHFSQREHDINDPYAHSVIAVANDAFRAFHDGYNLRAIYYETGAQNEAVAFASGFTARRYANGEPLEALPPALRPMLFGLKREQARLQMPGTPARNCFEHQPPLFRFSASQRRLLWLSLYDDSDEALMHALDVSVHGLKKLWRGIYERVEDQAPDFFGDIASDSDGKRGPEKRRQVLAYVRQRPEELRPWSQPEPSA